MTSPRPPPTWPEDASKQSVLSDVIVDLPLNELFLLMQGGYNDFRRKLEALNSHLDYRSTGWVLTPLPTAELEPTSRPVLNSVSGLKPNMMRKTTFISGKHATTEFSKLLEIGSKRAVVESYVETKAPYGDRFQVMQRTSFESIQDDTSDKKNGKKNAATRMTVTCAIIYTGSINGMIKGMIEKGSREGMSKGAANGVKVLKEKGKVTPAVVGGAAGGAGAVSAAPAAGERRILYKEHLELLFGKRLVAVLEPYAFLTSELLQQMHPSLSALTPNRIGIVCLSFVAFQAVHLLLELLIMLETGSMRHNGGRGFVGHGLQLFFRLFRTPSGMHEVLSNFMLLVVVRAFFGFLSLGLPDPRARDGEYGKTYSGYAKAIANAEPQYVGIDAKSEFALEQIGKGMDYFAKKFKSKATEAAEHRQRRRDKLKEKLKTITKPKDEQSIHHHHNHHLGLPHRHRNEHEDINLGNRGGSPGTDSAVHDGDTFVLPMNDSLEYSAPSLPPERTVVEEMFECQRHQPFRGWGSKWPGHFLPTDHLNKWNVRIAKSNGIYTSQNFEDVVPELPEGWKWVESEWSLDLSGRTSGSTDTDGWSYALDFPRAGDIVYPFPKGSGKSKMSDFVRTRRWLRTRILPIEEEAGEIAQTVRATDTEQATSPAGSAADSPKEMVEEGSEAKDAKDATEVRTTPVARRDAPMSPEPEGMQQHDSLFYT